MNTNRDTKRITRIAMTAGAYTALTMILAPVSFGAIQLRVAESMMVLSCFGYDYVIGLTIGCLLSNLYGVLSSMNPAGMMDIVFGTLATLLAGILSYHFRNFKIRRIPVLSLVMTAVVNAVIISLELALALQSPDTLFIIGLEIAVSEALVLAVIGIPLYSYLFGRFEK